MIATTIYVLWIIVVPPSWIETGSALRTVWLFPRVQVYRLVSAAFGSLGVEAQSRHLLACGFFIVTCIMVPWSVMLLWGRGQPVHLGWRRPNRLLWRIVGCSFVVSVPFLLWMVLSPGFAAFYRPYFETSVTGLIGYYLVVLFCEHSFFEGIMLGVFRANHRWPDPPVLEQTAARGAARALQWLGLAQSTSGAMGVRRITRWLGLADGCVAPILLSGVLFGCVHHGKDGREFLLSFPGGVFLSYLAYRCNSWHAPYCLHTATVVMAGLMMLGRGL